MNRADRTPADAGIASLFVLDMRNPLLFGLDVALSLAAVPQFGVHS